MDEAGMRKSFRPQAERQVKLRLALEQIAKQEQLAPTAEELDAEYRKLADSYKMDVEKIKAAISEKNLTEDIVVEKAMTLVEESADVKAEA